MNRKSHNKALKPTQAQGLCGLTHCYTDTPLGCFYRRMKKVFLLLIIFIVSLPTLFSEDNKRNILEGSWAEDVTCDYYIKSGEPYKVEIVNGEKALQECFFNNKISDSR